MKILMFGWEFPPHISGGLGTACYGMTRGLKTLPDVDITFVVPKVFGGEGQPFLHVVGASDIPVNTRLTDYRKFLKEIEYIEVNSRLVPYTSPEEYQKKQGRIEENQSLIQTKHQGKLSFSGGYGKDLFQEIANYAIVASVIASRDGFDIIHAHDWLTFPAGIAAKKATGKPLIIHVHATDFDRSGGKVNPMVFEIEKKGMQIADRIIAVSNLTRQTIIEKYHISPDKIVTIHNAVEPLPETERVMMKRGVNDKIVTFLGRVTLQKGPEYFIEAAYRVLQRMDNVRFVMAGSGELLERMVSHVARLKIADRFHFTGFLQGDDVYRMFNISDVYVMPSVSEPFGISPLEAMQSNVPVIISHQSGVSEILQYAIKIDFWDINAMADAIYGFLNYPALSSFFKKYGKIEVDNLKWENTAIQVKELYNSMLTR